MTENPERRRVTISGPRRLAPRGHQPYQVRQEIDEQSPLGEVYIRSLTRTQLRLGLVTVAFVTAALVALPALFALIPQLDSAKVFGFGVAWLVLGVLVYPVVLLVAWRYVRRAGQNEQEFRDLVERS